MLLCFSSVFSADPERGVNDAVFFFLFLFAYLLSRGGEREYSEARFNTCPQRAVGLTCGPCPSPGSLIVFMLVDRWREGVGVDS